eukprot:SAG11_NODE_15936_length_562_cov_0.734341_1_plen_78_part_00
MVVMRPTLPSPPAETLEAEAGHSMADASEAMANLADSYEGTRAAIVQQQHKVVAQLNKVKVTSKVCCNRMALAHPLV